MLDYCFVQVMIAKNCRGFQNTQTQIPGRRNMGAIMNELEPTRRKHAIVLVHGVGATRAGEMLRQFVGDLGGPIDNVMFDGDSFERVRLNDHEHISEAYEVFWADLKPDIRGLGLVAFLFKLILALSQLGAEGWRDADTGANLPSYAGRLLKDLLFGFVLVVPALFFSFLHVFALSGWPRVGGVLLAVAPVFAVAWALRGCDKIVYVSLILAPIFSTVAIVANALGVLDPIGSPDPLSAKLVAWIISGIYSGALILIVIAVLETAWHTIAAWFRTKKAHITPFVVALLWAVNLAVYSKKLQSPENAGYEAWTKTYSHALPYDLAFMEIVLAGATAIFGLYVSLGLFLYFLRLKIAKRRNKGWPLGDFLRHWLSSSLFLFVLLSSVVGGAYAMHVFLFPREQIYLALPWLHALGQLNVFQVHSLSSTRLLGFLPSIVWPLRLGLLIAADVIFYILPPDSSRLAVGPDARKRFRKLIEGLTEKFKERLLIVAYSQGSMIAADVLAAKDGAQVNFITAGSPVTTLYDRFLGINGGPELFTWKNFYRESDFIGGPIPRALGGNFPVVGNFDHHHMNYFSEPELRDAIAASCEIVMPNSECDLDSQPRPL